MQGLNLLLWLLPAVVLLGGAWFVVHKARPADRQPRP